MLTPGLDDHDDPILPYSLRVNGIFKFFFLNMHLSKHINLFNSIDVLIQTLLCPKFDPMGLVKRRILQSYGGLEEGKCRKL